MMEQGKQPMANHKTMKSLYVDDLSLCSETETPALALNDYSLANVKKRFETLKDGQRQQAKVSHQRMLAMLRLLKSMRFNHTEAESELLVMASEIELNLEKAIGATCAGMQLAGEYIDMLCVDFESFHSEMNSLCRKYQAVASEIVTCSVQAKMRRPPCSTLSDCTAHMRSMQYQEPEKADGTSEYDSDVLLGQHATNAQLTSCFQQIDAGEAACTHAAPDHFEPSAVPRAEVVLGLDSMPAKSTLKKRCAASETNSTERLQGWSCDLDKQTCHEDSAWHINLDCLMKAFEAQVTALLERVHFAESAYKEASAAAAQDRADKGQSYKDLASVVQRVCDESASMGNTLRHDMLRLEERIRTMEASCESQGMCLNKVMQELSVWPVTIQLKQGVTGQGTDGILKPAEVGCLPSNECKPGSEGLNIGNADTIVKSGLTASDAKAGAQRDALSSNMVVHLKRVASTTSLPQRQTIHKENPTRHHSPIGLFRNVHLPLHAPAETCPPLSQHCSPMMQHRIVKHYACNVGFSDLYHRPCTSNLLAASDSVTPPRSASLSAKPGLLARRTVH